MGRPSILTVDDDAAVSQAVARDLRKRYGEQYRVVRATSGPQALDVLRELALRSESVALIVSDFRMPEMTGIEFLEQSIAHAPHAKRVLLTAYADTDAAIRAINDIGLDHYLLKPWAPPEDRLFPVLDDLLADWHDAHGRVFDGVRVLDHRWSERAHEVKTFLARNHVPYQWLDVERDEEGARLLEVAGPGARLPLVLIPDGDALEAPGTTELAEALGLRTRAAQPLYDLAIVGGGPAGLAAAVYGASEGLRTVVVEREAPGGQAGTSARIENYLGFPRGVAGDDLSQRAVAQARRFGAEMVLAREVTALETRGPVQAVRFEDGSEIEARAVLVATGVSYRMLAAPGLAGLTGRGVFYGATASEAKACEGEEVYLVGAANSAGQAALNFARYAKRVVMIVRGAGLEASMSSYLVERLVSAPNVDIRTGSEVTGASGSAHLEAITITDRATATDETVAANWLFVFIGASPRTDWLGDAVMRDANGFLVTGEDARRRSGWPLHRAPFALETSVPGVFAAGDVRLDSMKRVASAVGEGAMAVHLVHGYLESL